MEIPISFNRFSRLLMTPLGLGPRHCRLTVGPDDVAVRLGWAFRATVPRPSITAAVERPERVLSLGAHGWRGRWLVNGANSGLVTLTIEPPARARVLGVPIRLRQLTVSVAVPSDLVGALAVQ